MSKDLYKDISDCIGLVDREINLHKQNIEADGNIETLENIKYQLDNMRKYMSPLKYMPNYNYILRDSLWDYLKIADELLRVYHQYIKIID